MIAADFFVRLGFFVIPQFFSQEMCCRLRTSVASAEWKPATVAEGSKDAYKEKVRKTNQHTIDNGMKEESVHG